MSQLLYLEMSQLSQNVPTVSKCPNYLKMSQLSQNVPTHYFKVFQLQPGGKFACRIKFSWRIISLTKIRIIRKYAIGMKLCEIMRRMLKYAKKCGKHQIVRKVAENVKLCDSASTAPKSSFHLVLFHKKYCMSTISWVLVLKDYYWPCLQSNSCRS